MQNFYNFLHDNSYSDTVTSAGTESMKSFSPQLYEEYLMSMKNKAQIKPGDLSTFMNGPIREKLKIIPSNVT
jgi:serine carboxypeptidase 1